MSDLERPDPATGRETYDTTLIPYLIDEVRDVRADVRDVRAELRSVEQNLRAEIAGLRGELRDTSNRILAFMGLLFTALAILMTIFQFALG